MARKLSVPALPKASNETGSRRKFLKVAGGAAAVGATLGFPMIAKGQAGPISMRFQSTWPTKWARGPGITSHRHSWYKDVTQSISAAGDTDAKSAKLRRRRAERGYLKPLT